MNILPAPWRYDYITQPHAKDAGCPFCNIPMEEDRARGVIYRSTTCFVLLNAYPYSSGHVMILPYRHVPSLLDLTEEEAQDFQTLQRRVLRCLQSALNPQGFNLGINLGAAAGAGVAGHLHCHIVPRWHGDSNFMQVTAATSVIPLSLDRAWELFKEHWQ